MSGSPSTTDASTPTAKTPAITHSATLTVPHFTPPSGCLDLANIWYEEAPCSLSTGWFFKATTKPQPRCNYFNLNHGFEYNSTIISTDTCLPGSLHAATQCPEYYTPVGTRVTERGTMTSQEIFCCPTTYNFYYDVATLTDQGGSSASLFFTECVASSPSFPGRAPWTLTVSETVSEWAEGSIFKMTKTSRTREFDPKDDVLLAPAVTISFVIDTDGKTCAPDCEHPWTGGLWPMPPPTYTSPPSGSDSSYGMQGLVVFIGTMSAVGFVIFVAFGWCCFRTWKRTRMERETSLELVQ
ncbi:uncharacterized protein BKA55DRAFT_525734 [Fusarium redolens]|uniref:Uncharacterized protein n=1 Tax=Fusarium redolens TaxID=48865 RepID=A0A9P9G1K7_FUSRE|nr:uncharacterized protein BKA55DRAFT_525734 [Fusarium redolens]KAH7230628.1 hypothetical protein BKA55DRAFT_525734 [Fusarium redolens]